MYFTIYIFNYIHAYAWDYKLVKNKMRYVAEN